MIKFKIIANFTHKGVVYSLNEEKIDWMWKELFTQWAKGSSWFPESSKPIILDMLELYKKTGFDIEKIPSHLFYVWIKEILRFRTVAVSYYNYGGGEEGLSAKQKVDTLLAYYMWNHLYLSMLKSGSKEQLIQLTKDLKIVEWHKIILPPEESEKATVYFLRAASGYEISLESTEENVVNRNESEKMKQFLEVVEPNFFTTIYDIFDFYFFGLIIFFFYFFFKFLNKLFIKLKNNNVWRKFF